MTARWADRLYGSVVALYPWRFRKEYGEEMKLVFNDMVIDPEVSRKRVWLSVIRDIANLTGGGLGLGALFGALVVLIWFVGRSDIVPLDTTLGLGLIALLFVAAGFTGAWRSGTIAGGIWVGFGAGLVSAVTVPGDYLLFRNFPFYDLMSLVFTMATSAAIAMLFVGAGAVLPDSSRHRHRIRRSIGAFVGAWRQDPELSP